MLFSSTIFLFLFLPCVLLFYYILPRCVRNFFLFLVSLIFYAWGEPRVVFILLGTVAVNYLGGYLVERFRGQKRKVYSIIFVTVAVDLGILFIFKYLNFVTASLREIAGMEIVQTQIALPIGISFFTFQALSYVIDVYRKNGKMQKNPLNVGLYITFFPQLIAGPIVRYETVADEIDHRRENWGEFAKGTKRFLLGLSKKILLANTFAVLADRIIDGSVSTVMLAWLGAISYTMQIFFDFSAYSDMAIGLGLMFGFHFLENFNYPYIAKTITEFWRRWHISLSTWFRDYVYIPLGGSRISKSRTIWNLGTVWILTGIWHGANWNFVLWGVYYFLLLTIEKLLDIPRKTSRNKWKYVYQGTTLILVIIGWVVFRIEDMHALGQYLLTMFGIRGDLGMDETALMYLRENWLFMIVGLLCCTPVMRKVKEKAEQKTDFYIFYTIGSCLAYSVLFLVCTTYLIKGSYNPFIYFNF